MTVYFFAVFWFAWYLSNAEQTDFFTTPAPIIADFASANTGFRFLPSTRRFNNSLNKQDKLNSQMFKLSGNKTPILVDESIGLSLKKLLFEIRKIVEDRFSCWHLNEEIFTRKNLTDKPTLVISEQNAKHMRISVERVTSISNLRFHRFD